MIIRPALPTDAAEIARVHVASWRAAYRGLLPDSLLDRLSVTQRTGVWETHLQQASARTLVAEGDGRLESGRSVNGRLVGFISYGLNRDGDVDATQVAEIYAIYLDPATWRQGIGQALMQHAIDDLSAQEFTAVSLWFLTSNARARAFYEALGFKVDGGEKIVTRKDGIELRETRCRRQLGE